jgi:hypothetical protein
MKTLQQPYDPNEALRDSRHAEGGLEVAENNKSRVDFGVDNLERCVLVNYDVVAEAEQILKDADNTKFAQHDIVAEAEEATRIAALQHDAEIQRAQRAARDFAFDAKSTDIVPRDAAQSIADEDEAHIAGIDATVDRIRRGEQ